MSDIEKIIYAALFGVFVVVIGQIISKFLIDPLYEFKKEIGSIAHSIIFHADLIVSAVHVDKELAVEDTPSLPERLEAEKMLRDHSCGLIAKSHAVPFIRFWLLFPRMPSFKDIKESRSILMWLSGRIVRGIPDDNKKDLKELKNLLRIKF